jgi:hypothetical protein
MPDGATFGSVSPGGVTSGTVRSVGLTDSTSGTTTVYLIARASFAISTMTAYGSIRARRVR